MDECLGRAFFPADFGEGRAGYLEINNARFPAAEEPRPIEIRHGGLVDLRRSHGDGFVGDGFSGEARGRNGNLVGILPFVLLEGGKRAQRLVWREKNGAHFERQEVDRLHRQDAAAAEDLRHGQFGQIEPRRHRIEDEGKIPLASERFARPGHHRITDAQRVFFSDFEFSADCSHVIAHFPREAGDLRFDAEKVRPGLGRDVRRQAPVEDDGGRWSRVDVVAAFDFLDFQRTDLPDNDFAVPGEFRSAIHRGEACFDEQLPCVRNRQRGGRADHDARRGVARVRLGRRIRGQLPPQVPVFRFRRNGEVILRRDGPHHRRHFHARVVDELKKRGVRNNR